MRRAEHIERLGVPSLRELDSVGDGSDGVQNASHQPREDLELKYVLRVCIVSEVKQPRGGRVASNEEGNREYSVAVLKVSNGDDESNYTCNPHLSEVEVPPVVHLRAVEAVIKGGCHSSSYHDGDSSKV
jgi:hypothetical protein